MNDSGNNNISFLDGFRYHSGNGPFRKYFQDLVRKDISNALQYINDDRLRFSSLFLLHTDIMESGLFSQLSLRNQMALETVQRILNKETSSRGSYSSAEEAMPSSVLRWILETGYPEDGLDNRYDQVLEITAVLLVKLHKDISILPMVVDMMFNRYRKGSFIYDLVWAFYESRAPYGLTLAANRLCSTHWKDVELARKLLRFVPGFEQDTGMDPARQYSNFLQWFHENSPFLYYTGETFQQTSQPIPYMVSLDAKYLCNTISEGSNSWLRSLTSDENRLLERFQKLDLNTRNQLSNYSYWLYRRNPYEWKVWLHSPVEEQIMAAQRAMGGLS